MSTDTHCQICGRLIQAKKGLIAHHGYKRPDRGSGWQTASCMGAKHLPYEVSRDLIPVAKEAVERFVVDCEEAIAREQAEPREVFKVRSRRDYHNTMPLIEVKRPDGFNPADPAERHHFDNNRDGTYRFVRRRFLWDMEQEVRYGRLDVEALQVRYDAWTPPAA
jgi:hypothetical protein